MDVEALIWQPGWKPTTDLEVSQIIRYLTQMRRETERIVNSAKAEMMALETIGKETEHKYITLEAKLLDLLGGYVMEEVDDDDRKETKNQVKYKLARGEIIISKPTFKIEKPKDDTDLKLKHPQFVKKSIEVKHVKAYHKKSGEVFEDVTVMEVPRSISVKTTL
jgi:hypothetical protein